MRSVCSALESRQKISDRIKDSFHLREKLGDKILEGKALAEFYRVAKENFFVKVTDAATYRMMHLSSAAVSAFIRGIRNSTVSKR